MNAPMKLRRQTFKTSRLLEFCSERELTNVCGHPVTDWPLVVLKEMTDNALDATEESGVAPVINITVEASSVTIADNGPGLPAKAVKDILDYRVRVSSREAYCSPSRGQQGNALSSIIPMAFVVDGDRGETTIASRGVVHRIAFRVDRLRQEPKINHLVENCPEAKSGTKITIHWPDAAGYPDGLLSKAKPRFLQIAADTTWLNPHLSLTVDWSGKREIDIAAVEPEWRKWGPSDPTSAHWYDIARLERYIAAHVARDQDRGRDRTVREFIAEFRGLSASAKQKVILDDIGASRMSLSEFFSKEGQPDRKRIGRLLDALKKHTKPVRPPDLGIIGKEYLLQRVIDPGIPAQSPLGRSGQPQRDLRVRLGHAAGAVDVRGHGTVRHAFAAPARNHRSTEPGDRKRRPEAGDGDEPAAHQRVWQPIQPHELICGSAGSNAGVAGVCMALDGRDDTRSGPRRNMRPFRKRPALS